MSTVTNFIKGSIEPPKKVIRIIRQHHGIMPSTSEPLTLGGILRAQYLILSQSIFLSRTWTKIFQISIHTRLEATANTDAGQQLYGEGWNTCPWVLDLDLGHHWLLDPITFNTHKWNRELPLAEILWTQRPLRTVLMKTSPDWSARWTKMVILKPRSVSVCDVFGNQND